MDELKSWLEKRITFCEMECDTERFTDEYRRDMRIQSKCLQDVLLKIEQIERRK